MRRLLLLACFVSLTPLARAVIVRGKVTSSLGVPVAGARVQLIQGQKSVADALSAPDGTYEIRAAFSGRFLLLTSPPAGAPALAPQIGSPFYAGRSDLLSMDVALNESGITPRTSAQPTLSPTPTRELAEPVWQIAADQLLTESTLVPQLRAASGSFIVQQGPQGSPAFVYLRGAPPQTVLGTVDSVTANPLGGALNLSQISSTSLAAFLPTPVVEVTPGPNPLYLTGADGAVLTLDPAHAQTLYPTVMYTGDAGNLGSYRNEAVGTAAHGRFDLLGAFSRYNISETESQTPFHLTTFASNIGYQISSATSFRIKARYDASVAALASPYTLFLRSPEGKNAAQNLFGSATLESRSAGKWHNVLRFGIARTRGQTYDFFTPPTGLPVTLVGANGYTASGIAAFDPLPAREDVVTNRNEATYQTEYQAAPWIGLTGEFRYQDERAADVLPTAKSTLAPKHFSGSFGLQGELRHRVFYETAGFIDHSNLRGLTGSPRLGLTYVPVRPGRRRLRGTSLHAMAATGNRELSLLEDASLATTSRVQIPRSRVFDAGITQNILDQRLILRATYFHSQFSHEFEPVALSIIASQPVLSQTLALRSQGFEGDLRYQPLRRLYFEGGYNYLAVITSQSAAPAVFNPALPTHPIGGLTALIGQRPFHRPPQSGFVLAEYSGTRLDASLKAALVSRSDDSTNLLQTPSLLLPNRNLAPGYASVDARVSLVLARHFTAFTQLSNLTNDRHIAPFGYLSSPFLVRAGLRVRIGGE